jgi:hypothetical protein
LEIPPSPATVDSHKKIGNRELFLNDEVRGLVAEDLNQGNFYSEMDGLVPVVDKRLEFLEKSHKKKMIFGFGAQNQ